ncbi:MAG: rRNA maturation RNase YbeY [Ruminococcus sp.]|nr:rRNA maturation RNase YbeY [Ruminococcus sp.]
MKYEINDNYNVDFKYNYLKKVIKRTLKHEKVKNAYFSVVFVGNEEIQELNKSYRGIDKITDVISFALEDNKDLINNDTRILGDIYICIPRALEQAEEYGHSLKRELSFLTVHGLLHLLGYDHQTKEDEEVMFKLQELILDEENIRR